MRNFIGRREQEQGSYTKPKSGLVITRLLFLGGGRNLSDRFKIPHLGDLKP